jgi:hypothetical protein
LRNNVLESAFFCSRLRILTFLSAGDFGIRASPISRKRRLDVERVWCAPVVILILQVLCQASLEKKLEQETAYTFKDYTLFFAKALFRKKALSTVTRSLGRVKIMDEL